MKTITEEELLKEYYNKRFRIKNMPEFDLLSNREKNIISDTLGFASYRLSYHFNKCSDPIKQKIVYWLNKHLFKS